MPFGVHWRDPSGAVENALWARGAGSPGTGGWQYSPVGNWPEPAVRGQELGGCGGLGACVIGEILLKMGTGMRGREGSLKRWEGCVLTQHLPLPLRRGPPAPVSCVWRQQQREALWHLCLQWLQWLLQEER